MSDHFFFRNEQGAREVRITANGYMQFFKDRVERMETQVEKERKVAHCLLFVKGEPSVRTFSVQASDLPEATLRSSLWEQYPEQLLQHAVVRLAFESTFPKEVKTIKEALCGSTL